MVIADPSEQRVAPAIIEQAARFRGALCSEACRSVAIGDLDRDQQRFQLQHALLREELRDLAPLGELLQVAGK